MGGKFVTRFLLLAFGAVALFVGLRGHTAAFLGSLLILLAMGIAYLWNRFVFAKLTLERKINRRLVDFATPITMQLTITNRKVLPVFGLKLEYAVTPGLAWEDVGPLIEARDGSENIFQGVFNLNWYEKRSRTYNLRALRRGRFQFGTGRLSYGDPFGFFKNSKENVFSATELIVFPKVVPLEGISGLNTYLFGSRPADGWIFTDPLHRIGTRPYQSTDSARLINWKATARHIQTQVNVEKPSFDQQVYLVLDQPPHLPWWAQKVANNLEMAIMATASLIHVYSEAGYAIRLLTNLVSQVHGLGPLPETRARGRAQRDQLLTSLALLQSFSVEEIHKVLLEHRSRIPQGSTVVILTTNPSELSPGFMQMLRSLQRQSRVAVLRILPGVKKVPKQGSFAEWRIEGGTNWHEVAKLELL